LEVGHFYMWSGLFGCYFKLIFFCYQASTQTQNSLSYTWHKYFPFLMFYHLHHCCVDAPCGFSTYKKDKHVPSLIFGWCKNRFSKLHHVIFIKRKIKSIIQCFHPWLFHSEISILLARSFFMGFSLTILGLLARLRVLVQQVIFYSSSKSWHSYCRFHTKLCWFEPYDHVNWVGLCNSPILNTHIPKGWNLDVICQEQRYRCMTWVHRASSSGIFFYW
jgi:hypothetical protein